MVPAQNTKKSFALVPAQNTLKQVSASSCTKQCKTIGFPVVPTQNTIKPMVFPWVPMQHCKTNGFPWVPAQNVLKPQVLFGFLTNTVWGPRAGIVIISFYFCVARLVTRGAPHNASLRS